MWRIMRRLQLVDRRIVYALILVVLVLPFVVPYAIPLYPDTYTRKFFDRIDEIANDPVEREKVVLVLTNWGPGTRGENEPQFEIVTRHLLRRHLKFVFVCTMGPPEYHDAAMAAFERAKAAEVQRARRLGEPTPTWEYGVDYLDFGYQNAKVFLPIARTVVTQPRQWFRQDYRYQRDLTDDASYPLLQRMHSANDLAAVIVVSHAEEAKFIAALVKSEYPDLKIGAAAMGIVANNLYPFVKSGQLFGLINSKRGASEYRALLNPDVPSTEKLDNALSFGKLLLLALVILGNVAFLITRWAERSGRLPPLERPKGRSPLPPLPRWFMWSLFGVALTVWVGSVAIEAVRFWSTDTIPRERLARASDDPQMLYPDYERVGVADLQSEAAADSPTVANPLQARYAQLQAELRFKQLIEQRIGEFLAALLTLGVLAFLLGDNRFYRVIEAIIMGGSLAYMLDQVDKILRPTWFEPIVNGLTGQADPRNALWLLLLVPGVMWYFTYSKKHRWVNQMIVAAFIGFMVAPEFKNQTNIIIPQVLDTIRPVWPWESVPVAATMDPTTGQTLTAATTAIQFSAARLEHLIFVLVAVLSLLYFVFCFRPKSGFGARTLTLSRLTLMVGFGIGFGNTVNTRLAWLAERVSFLAEDWLGKLLGG